MNGITMIETVAEVAQIILVFCGYALHWKMMKTKRERKLTLYEHVLKFFVMFGLIAWGFSYLALQLWV
ncbi:hypothetical protein [Bacillus sp. 179-C3.3 HS]|uniref:hypothetical protein n=1 Tax=Bacillus sp. 179-C3.3 HS TaxID=3232162 RepID=UPI0039A17D82